MRNTISKNATSLDRNTLHVALYLAVWALLAPFRELLYLFDNQFFFGADVATVSMLMFLALRVMAFVTVWA